ncbi:WYL domain-containing protein [uncultured Ruminococcus sp.]|uniref:helix-turn-helix transcriptional regulator n=1 Tax=uncultured Ruminococcus sp. TaxID=165186 RepID=UPI0025DA2704|nr:WYL domain-containing protein [uncultured Ruminococcus sp.]
MAGLSRQKQKLLTMKKLFESKTDESHSITGAKLIETLAADGIKAERKTIYDDIKTLCDSGMDIETTKDGHSNAYYLAQRTFQDEELFVLADAVASCRFLTKKKSQELIKKIQSLTSDYKAKQLRRMFYVENRVKNFNEQIYYTINKIQAGIFNETEIRFKYTEFNPDKKQVLKHGGEVYTVSPYSLVWENENYYLVCYCNKHEKICRYRVDRMVNVENTDTERRKASDEDKAEIANQQSVYGMYGGKLESVTMQFDNSLANAVIDKFGMNCHPHRNSENTFCLTADVQIAPTFWGWFFQFGTKARILAPENVVEQAAEYIEELGSCYKKV